MDAFLSSGFNQRFGFRGRACLFIRRGMLRVQFEARPLEILHDPRLIAGQQILVVVGKHVRGNPELLELAHALD